MTKRDILSIAFKILGVYSIMLAIAYLPVVFSTIVINIQKVNIIENEIVRTWQSVIMVLTPILMLVFSFILLKWGDLFAEKLVKSDTTSISSGANVNEKSIFILSLRIIGALQIVEAVPVTSRALVSFINVFRTSLHFNIFTYEGLNMFAGIIRLIIGIYLILGGKHLVKFAFQEKIAPK